MASDNQSHVDRIKSDPAFQELVRKRWSFAVLLTILMLFIYFGFVFLVAFNKGLLAKSLMGGVTTVGIPVGIFVIVSAFILTGIYVARANGEFDRITKQIVERMKK